MGAAMSKPPCGFFLIPLRILWLPKIPDILPIAGAMKEDGKSLFKTTFFKLLAINNLSSFIFL